LAPASRATEPRALAFYHTHTGERLRVTYAANGTYVPEALAEIDNFLRDFRTGDVHRMDPQLLDILHALRVRAGGRGTYEIISAYRSPLTNEMLRDRSNGVAKRSLHMDGKAMDVRLVGAKLDRLRDEALALQAGGVGYYPQSEFIHVDTGRVRRW
jgi:uncharacterized protein YcbK (DUF882 family)